MFCKDGDRLQFHYDAEGLYIEPWGENALRVRATKQRSLPLEDWALQKPAAAANMSISITEAEASIVNSKIMIFNQKSKLLLEEYARHRLDLQDPKCSSLSVEAREFKPIPGGDYHLTMRFEFVDKNEKIFGMSQYQQPYLDLKGLDLEMAQRNFSGQRAFRGVLSWLWVPLEQSRRWSSRSGGKHHELRSLLDRSSRLLGRGRRYSG